MKKYSPGDMAFIIENGRIVVPVMIVRFTAGFYTIKFKNKPGQIRLKAHRIYESENAAKKALGISDAPRYNPYNYE